MKQIVIRLLVTAALVSPLAACKPKKNNNPTVVTPTPPPTGGAFENQFGAGFGASFRKAAWSEPVDPKAGDVIPVDPNKDPVNF
jgi:hypothetical protein